MGARSFGLVSAVGASAGSRVFYNRVKGETEDDITALGFASLTVVRPSLLLGARTEFRFGERLFAPFGGWLPRASLPSWLRPPCRPSRERE
jgi:uncharacterized protein YbjT (DUF2867 family)